jgi:hypothetical protein
MKCAVEMVSGVITYIPCFIQIGCGIQCASMHAQTHTLLRMVAGGCTTKLLLSPEARTT